MCPCAQELTTASPETCPSGSAPTPATLGLPLLPAQNHCSHLEKPLGLPSRGTLFLTPLSLKVAAAPSLDRQTGQASPGRSARVGEGQSPTLAHQCQGDSLGGQGGTCWERLSSVGAGRGGRGVSGGWGSCSKEPVSLKDREGRALMAMLMSASSCSRTFSDLEQCFHLSGP